MPVPDETLESLCQDDVLLISYPRSGNTWLRRLLYEAILNQQKLESVTHVDDLIPDLHMHGLERVQRRHPGIEKRILKSHNVRDVPPTCAVYIVREPGDTLVSYYHFKSRHLKEDAIAKEPIDEFVLRMAETWSEHVAIGLDRHYEAPDRVLMVSYGMLHEDTGETLARIARFCRLNLSPEAIAASVTKNSFKVLKETAVPSIPGMSPSTFFRRGERGSAHDELQPETNELLKAKLGRLYREAEACATLCEHEAARAKSAVT